VTRPEGLSFTTPTSTVAGYKIPEDVEEGTPQVKAEQQQEDDHTSPIANLVEKPRAPPSTPTEVLPANEETTPFSFGGAPATPETPAITPKDTPAQPSPHTPPDLVPALGSINSFAFAGNANDPNKIEHPSPSPSPELVTAPNSFSFNEIHGIHAPAQPSNEPRVVPKKIPGHELLSSFMATSSPSTTQEKPQGVPPVSSPVIEPSSVQEPVGEEKSNVEKSEPDIVQPTSHEASPPLEPVASFPPLEKLESRVTDKTADAAPIQESGDARNLATASEEVGEGVVEKPVEHATDLGSEKEKEKPSPETQITSAPDTIAFRDLDEPEVSTSANTTAPANITASDKPAAPVAKTATAKPGALANLRAMTTKKWRGPSGDELKAMWVIPKYLSKDMADAVESKGVAIPQGPTAGEVIQAPTCPILVFINSKSGGRLGPELMEHFQDLISPEQVYDLAAHSPAEVLGYGLGCLDKLAASDECARLTRQNLRILVAGGDGTVGWVLSSVGAIREQSTNDTVPPAGVIPLGTGNDLSRSFNWGGEFSSTSKSTLSKYLVKTMNATVVNLDTWKAVVLPAKSVAAEDIQFPHAMKPQHHVPLPSSVAGERHDKDESAPAFEGLFFNYFSIGMDAQVAYGFHHLRDEKPWLARGRTANQMIYGTFGCTQGWFCTACTMAPRARGVSNILKLSVRRRGNSSKDWEEIHLPSNIRAVVICNLKSYAGGRNPWGKPSSSTRQKEGLGEQRCDDGLLEVMGLKDGWHSAFVLLEVATAVRLCQAEAIKIELNGRTRRKAYLQMDGEPWMQPMGSPTDDEPTVVIIEKLTTPSVLLKR
jgi:diacylglycerol kinase (ATP)